MGLASPLRQEDMNALRSSPFLSPAWALHASCAPAAGLISSRRHRRLPRAFLLRATLPHGSEVRVGDDHVVAERLQTPGDPFTLRRGFQQDLGRRPPAECLGEPLGFGANPALNHLASLSQETDLAFPLVQIDANMVHGWPPSPCAPERVISLWGTLGHHVESGVSRFIPSTLFTRECGAGLSLLSVKLLEVWKLTGSTQVEEHLVCPVRDARTKLAPA